MKRNFSNKKIATLFCGLGLLVSPTVFAQNTSTVSVTNSLTPENPIIVTATRTAKSGNDVLADYTYISREEIENSAQSSLPDLLQQQRGVQISSSGGSGNITSVYLRGTSNAQSLVLIDGVKIDSVGGGAIWNSIPLALIDHIEIIYGPQSTFYGSDAMGGVIQIFTKKGGGPTQLEASAGYGSYNTSITSAVLSGSLGKESGTTYSLGISQENSAGFNTVASNNTHYKGGQNYSTTYPSPYPTTPTGFTRLGATGSIASTWAQGQEMGLKIFASKNNWQYPNNEYSSGNPETDIGVNQLSIFTAYSKNKLTDIWSSYVQISNSTNTGQSLTSQSNDKLVTPAYDYLWQNDLKLGTDKVQVLLERNMQYANMDNSAYQTGCTYSASGCANINISQLRTTDSIAGAYELKRDDHLATIAVRNDNISSYGSKATYSAAYGYFLTKELRTNINYGTGFRAPAFNDLYYPGYGNPNLKPESNRNVEGGIHYETQQYGVHLTAYQNRIENFIVPINCPSTCDNPANYSGSYPTNFSLVQIKGASLGVDGRFEKLTLKASADAMSTVDQNTGLDVPNRANWVGNLLADYKIQKFNFGSNITLTGPRWGGVNSDQTANTYSMPSYTLVGIYGSYEIEKNLSTFIRWNNVFNSQYQTSYGYANAGSNVFVGLRYLVK
ncbi:TonB-dependent receptor [Polynucleobacter paneuropaeus]|nr:TonB-dependent receptor [Polynucleobacter paneuropaeus]